MRFTPQLRALDWLVARPIAHRGLHDKAKGVIENTESAFAAAIRHGYPIECDLRIAGDGARHRGGPDGRSLLQLFAPGTAPETPQLLAFCAH